MYLIKVCDNLHINLKMNTKGSFKNPFSRPSMVTSGAAMTSTSFLPSQKTLKGILAGKYFSGLIYNNVLEVN